MNEFLLPIGKVGSVVPGVYQGFNFDTWASTGEHDTTLTGSVSKVAIAPALAGYAYTAVPASGNIVLSGASALSNITTGDFTIELWGLITSTTVGYSTFLQIVNSGGTQLFTIRVGDGGFGNRLQFAMVPSTTTRNYSCSQTRTSLYNKWTHIAVVKKGGVMNLYVNGVAQALASGTGSTYTTGGRADGGSLSGALSYNTTNNCRVAEFVVYNSAKYNANFTPPVGGPLAA